MWIIIGCLLANVFCDAVAHQAEGTKICKKSKAIFHHQRKKFTRKSCMFLHSFATEEINFIPPLVVVVELPSDLSRIARKNNELNFSVVKYLS